MTHSSTKSNSGFLLIVVMVTIFMLVLSAYTFALLTVHEREVTELKGRQIQSRYVVESAVDYVRLMLSNDDATIHAMGGIWKNENQFQNKIVSINPQHPEQIGRFTILAPDLDPSTGNVVGFRPGLIDESSRLNLNTLTHADSYLPGGGRTLLMALPLMQEDVADSIMDWLDNDSEPRDYGAEADYYAGLSPPYAPKNGPMNSIEELLLIKGVTPQLLFGLDSNHNGVLDQDEQSMTNGTVYDPDMQLGWANYLTLFSKESNLNPEGLPRVNINSEDLELLSDDLGAAINPEWAQFIVLYRQNGPYTGDIPDDNPSSGFVDIDYTSPGSSTFTSVLDLIDAKTTGTIVDSEGGETEAVLQSPITMANIQVTIPLLMNNLTTIEGDNIPGRINIMHAPRQILQSIPGITPEITDMIIRQREFDLSDPNLADRNRQYETWILVEKIVDLQTMKTMLPFVCAGGDVFRAEIVGYFDDNVATSRAEVILDTTVPIPRILSWRPKSHLQRGYTIDTLGTSLGN